MTFIQKFKYIMRKRVGQVIPDPDRTYTCPALNPRVFQGPRCVEPEGHSGQHRDKLGGTW